MSKVNRFGLATLLMLAFLSGHAVAMEEPLRALEFLGKAVDMESRQLIYIEKHRMQLDSDKNYVRGTVDYFTPTGEKFASKRLDFENSAIAPALLFTDARVDKRIEIDNSNNNTSLSVTLRGTPLLEKVLQLPEKAVIDAGFDRFIAQHWMEIMAGEVIAFPFLAQTRGEMFDFEVVKGRERDNHVVMLVRPGNIFLRWLVDPIELVYEKRHRRLLSYSGLTNIQKVEQGKPSDEFYTAEIRYEYSPVNE